MSEREPISNEEPKKFQSERVDRWAGDSGREMVLSSDYDRVLADAQREIERLTIIIQSVRTCDDGDCLPCGVCLAAMRESFREYQKEILEDLQHDQ